jgi:hypothetical protein
MNCHCGGRKTHIDFSQLRVPTFAPAKEIEAIFSLRTVYRKDLPTMETITSTKQGCQESTHNLCEQITCVTDGLAEKHILRRFKYSNPVCLKNKKLAKLHHDCDLDCDYLLQKWNKAGNNIGASTIGLIFALLVLAQ